MARGDYVWYDLMTPDPERATRFYSRVVGWGTRQWEGEMPYTLWTVGEDSIGGVMQLPEEAKAMGAPPHWIAYVQVDDVDAACTQLTELGGRVFREGTDIPGVGRFAIVTDPHGAVFAIFAPAGDGMNKPESPRDGDFSWHELMAEDLDSAWSFYETMFGWQKTDSLDMGPAGLYQMYGNGRDETPAGGMMTKPAEHPGGAAWLYYAKVADLDVALAKVTELGGKVLNGPMEVPGGERVAQCLDDQGAAFALHSTS